jgi:hypothetical protein
MTSGSSSKRTSNSSLLLNLKAAAVAAQALLKSGLNDALLLDPSQNIGLAAVFTNNSDFYTQKRHLSNLWNPLLRNRL